MTALENRLAAMAARIEQLGDECAQLRRENTELRTSVGPARPWPPAVDPAPSGGTLSRRDIFGKVLGAAAVGVAGVALLDSGSPAAATDGDSVKAGQTTLAEHTTLVKYDGAAGFIGNVLNGSDSTAPASPSDFPAGVAGYAGAGATEGAGGIKNGVYGRTDAGGGNAVVGWNTAADGHTGGAAVRGQSDDTSGFAFAVYGEMSNTAPGGFSAGVRGVNRGTAGLGIGVYGSHDGAGWGVHGESASGLGVSGVGTTGVSGTGSDAGVHGFSAAAAGVLGQSENGRGGVFSGAKAQIRLTPGTRTTHPTSGQRGDLYADSSGRLWFCKMSGAHATWKQVA